MFSFVHDLSLEDALNSNDPLIQCLAVIDRRVGKRRLKTLVPEKFNDLARALLSKRKEAEGLEIGT